MKITDVRWIKIAGPLYHSQGGTEGSFTKYLVRIDTDKGIHGLGECENFMGAADALGYIRACLIGRDPLAVRANMSEIIFGTLPPYSKHSQKYDEKLFKNTYPTCPGMSATATPWGPMLWGTSAVEIALCDLGGKALKTPTYNLLGGQFRDRIRIYLDRSCPKPKDMDKLGAWKQMATMGTKQKFTQVKFDLEYLCAGADGSQGGDIWNRSITRAGMQKAIARLTAIREAIGWDVELCVDGHMNFNAIDSIRFGQEAAHLKLMWFEDPTPITNPDAMADIRAKCPIALCVGEMFSAEQFRLFIDKGACDILHPDVLFCGGLHECRRIGDYAELHYIPMAMHGNGGAIATIAAAHVAAATRNFLGLEYHFLETDWVGSYVQREGAALFDEGYIQMTDAPGLGITLNVKIVKKYLAPGEQMF